MFLISQPHMLEKLAKSWMFLGGVDLTFSVSTIPISGDNKHSHRVVLPVIFEDQESSRALAISLIIDDTEAKRVATHMFGINNEEVTEDDIKDACKESCNVLGGGLIMGTKNTLGLPYEISADDFLKLQQDSKLDVTFTSNQPYGDRIILSILDINNKIGSTV